MLGPFSRPPAQLLPFVFRCLQGDLGAFADQIPLHLRKQSEYGAHDFGSDIGRLIKSDVFLDADDLDALLNNFAGQPDHLAHAPPQSGQFANDQRIASLSPQLE